MKKIIPFILISLGACRPVDSPQNQIDFDRTVFLRTYAERIIIPGYQGLSDSLNQLKEVLDDRSAAQAQWKSAYRAFLTVTAFNFGPAEEQVLQKSLTEEIATFPVDADLIRQKMTSGNFNFEDFRRDSRGFLALEYLLFDDGAWNENGREAYAEACLNDLLERVNSVSNRWPAFKDEFILNDGTSAGSSTSALYNEFLKSFEGLKNFKIGLPLGLRPGQTSAVPENVEAFYSGNSLEFARLHFEVLQQVWSGVDDGGFKAYLKSVEGGEALIQATENQIIAVHAAFDDCKPGDFGAAILDQNPNLIKLHTELQKLTRYFKSDMSSLLGIAITFSSGDGD